jgi:Ca-activated chloride channel homolog
MSEFLIHFRFAQPQWLLLLLLALALLILRRGKGAATAVIFPNLGILLSLGLKVRQAAWYWGVPLAFIALVLSIFALARPVWRDEYQSRSASGIDIMIAFDVSLSMEIPDFVDQGVQARRIDVAKKVVDEFIRGRPEDRMGLVAFAGRPRDASPITLDHEWLRNSLGQLRLNDREEQGTVKEQGTAIGSAIAAAATRLQVRDAKSKVIVLITDGASNSGKISPLDAAEQAQTLGIKIYTVAIGTTEGRVDRSVQQFPYQEFDLPTLKKIASMTGAEHYWAQDLAALKKTFRTIDNLEKTDAKSLVSINDTELFQGFVGAALLAALAAAVFLTFNLPAPN